MPNALHILHFNSRPHKEVDACLYFPSFVPQDFNSRPHKEVDLVAICSNLSVLISIHDLTRRSTVVREVIFHKIWLFQFTTSQGGRRIALSASSPSFTFQFTTSQGGRRGNEKYRLIIPTFQFTTSQGGRHKLPLSLSCGDIFQFTTSQGGRQP